MQIPTSSRYRYLAALVLASLSAMGFAAEGDSALALFEKRIVPILKSPKASSCSECHLSGVDLKDYIRDDQAQTFAALRDQGLIDVAAPDKSKLLDFIGRKPERPTIVSAKVREEEYAAFQAWIRAAVKDPQLLNAKPAGKDYAVGPNLPVEVIRHSRQDQILLSFNENIMSESLRCAGCHDPSKNSKQVEKHGERISWVRGRSPSATLAWLLEHQQINLEEPEKSLLLTKPTNQVEHGGGIKLTVSDRTYTQFLSFIQDYAASSQGKYATVNELPAPKVDISAASDIWFKLTDIPPQYIGKTLRVEITAAEGTGWAKTPAAVADRIVYPKSTLWQQHLSLVAARNSPQAVLLERGDLKLPAGQYRVRVWVDTDEKLKQTPPAPLNDADLIGTIELRSHWPGGYGNMTVARLPVK